MSCNFLGFSNGFHNNCSCGGNSIGERDRDRDRNQAHDREQDPDERKGSNGKERDFRERQSIFAVLPAAILGIDDLVTAPFLVPYNVTFYPPYGNPVGSSPFYPSGGGSANANTGIFHRNGEPEFIIFNPGLYEISYSSVLRNPGTVPVLASSVVRANGVAIPGSDDNFTLTEATGEVTTLSATAYVEITEIPTVIDHAFFTATATAPFDLLTSSFSIRRIR